MLANYWPGKKIYNRRSEKEPDTEAVVRNIALCRQDKKERKGAVTKITSNKIMCDFLRPCEPERSRREEKKKLGCFDTVEISLPNCKVTLKVVFEKAHEEFWELEKCRSKEETQVRALLWTWAMNTSQNCMRNRQICANLLAKRGSHETQTLIVGSPRQIQFLTVARLFKLFQQQQF